MGTGRKASRDYEVYILKLQDALNHATKVNKEDKAYIKKLEERIRSFGNGVMGNTEPQLDDVKNLNSMDIFSFMDTAFDLYKKDVLAKEDQLNEQLEINSKFISIIESLKEQLALYINNPDKVNLLTQNIKEKVESGVLGSKAESDKARSSSKKAEETQEVYKAEVIDLEEYESLQNVKGEEDSSRIESEEENPEEGEKLISLEEFAENPEIVNLLPAATGEKFYLDSITETAKFLGKDEKYVIESIAFYGLSKMQDIIAKARELCIADINSDFSDSTINRTIRNLVSKKILKREKVKLANSFYVYEFSDFGQKVFKELYPNKKIKETEAQRLRKEHSSLDHGYLIMEAADILRKKGYLEVQTSRTGNAIKLMHGKSLIPDIKAIHPVTHQERLFEVETGTTPYDDFYVKCSKITQVTQEIIIVVPNKDVLTDNQQKLDSWIKKLTETKSLGILSHAKIYLGTIKTLAEKDLENWDYVRKFDKSGKEMGG